MNWNHIPAALSKVFGVVLASLLVLTCSNDASQSPLLVYIKVDVSQLPADTQSITVAVTLDGTPQRKSPYTLQPPATEFWVELDSGSSGHLSIIVDGVQTGGCSSSSGRFDKQIAGEPYTPAIITMSILPSPMCLLTVRVNGDGRVASDKIPGIDCRQQCTATYALNQPLTLKAYPDRPTQKYVWSGACRGSADCQFVVSGPQTVNVDFTPKVCTQDASKQFNWCWENPLIQGNALWGVWVAPDKTVYAVGDSGTVIQWNGIAWSLMDSSTTADLRAVWGSSAGDVWASGAGGTMIHLQGGKWSGVNSGTPQALFGMAGTGPGDAWAVGDAGAVVHWDGTQWLVSNTGIGDPLHAVWTDAANDVWTVGDNGRILRWNGSAWAPLASGTAQTLNGVWGTGPGDVWVAGDKTMLHWTGAALVSSGNFSGQTLYRLWGTGTNNIYVSVLYGAIYRWDGNQWNSISPPTNGTLLSVAGTDPSNVWAVGSNGSIVFYDGSGWKSANQGIAGDYTNLRAGWASTSTDAWVTGTQSFGVASEFTMHWDGLQWTYVALPDKAKPLYAMWGTAPDNVWGVGDTFVRWNGSSWTQYPPPTPVRVTGIWGNGPNDIWAVGNLMSGGPPGAPGTLLRWNGSAWQTMAGTPAGWYYGIYVSGSEAWVAGDQGHVWYFNGASWTQQQLSTADSLNSISALARDNIYVASSRNAVFHWDGGQWSGGAVPGANTIRGVLTVQPGEAWIPHDQSISRYDGATWTNLDVGTHNILNGIFGTSTDLWGFGQGGTILHYRR